MYPCLWEERDSRMRRIAKTCYDAVANPREIPVDSLGFLQRRPVSVQLGNAPDTPSSRAESGSRAVSMPNVASTDVAAASSKT